MRVTVAVDHESTQPLSLRYHAVRIPKHTAAVAFEWLTTDELVSVDHQGFFITGTKIFSLAPSYLLPATTAASLRPLVGHRVTLRVGSSLRGPRVIEVVDPRPFTAEVTVDGASAAPRIRVEGELADVVSGPVKFLGRAVGQRVRLAGFVSDRGGTRQVFVAHVNAWTRRDVEVGVDGGPPLTLPRGSELLVLNDAGVQLVVRMPGEPTHTQEEKDLALGSPFFRLPATKRAEAADMTVTPPSTSGLVGGVQSP